MSPVKTLTQYSTQGPSTTRRVSRAASLEMTSFSGSLETIGSDPRGYTG
jgi:hypothetical protein